MNYLVISRLFFSRKCFSENKKKIISFIPFPSSLSAHHVFFLRSTAAPSILGPVAAQHPQLAAQPYPLNHRVKSAGAPQTILAFALPPWPSQFQPSAGPIHAPPPAGSQAAPCNPTRQPGPEPARSPSGPSRHRLPPGLHWSPTPPRIAVRAGHAKPGASYLAPCAAPREP
jgi:hypothetical protein